MQVCIDKSVLLIALGLLGILLLYLVVLILLLRRIAKRLAIEEKNVLHFLAKQKRI